MEAFLDLEATVEHENEDSEDERDEVERDIGGKRTPKQIGQTIDIEKIEFLDDRSYSESTINVLAAIRTRTDIVHEEEEFEVYMDGILSKAIRSGQTTEYYVSHDHPDEYVGSIMAVQQGSDDYPLWRVECRVSGAVD